MLFAGGLVLLLVGGKLLVSASVDAARRLGVSPLVVGLTLVAWGTSAPELALNLYSALQNRADLALGNVVGANICNLGLVLGFCALLRPLVVQVRLIRVEIWLNALALVFMAAIGLVGGYSRWEALLLLAGFVIYSAWTIWAAIGESRPASATAASDSLGPDPTQPAPPISWPAIGVFFLGGLACLGGGGALASDGATGIALRLGVPAALVGVTIVAIGTTLPELVTGVLAVRGGQTDLAMGNALGSCLFNAGAIFGLVGAISPPTPEQTPRLALAFMAAFGLAIIPISRTFGRTVSRLEGGLLLTGYAAFLAISGIAALQPAGG